ncbi:MAG: hypothetical protein M1426_01295 [Patescibacteria group bacterium]|nr:hypothetical protein [Patescibacteria group bacterium]
MASRQEDLRRAYPSRITPDMFGRHFNERPQPDALGRTPATPLEIQKATRGEFEILPPQPAANPRGRRERVVPEYERLRQERERRKREARLRRNCGNGTP